MVGNPLSAGFRTAGEHANGESATPRAQLAAPAGHYGARAWLAQLANPLRVVATVILTALASFYTAGCGSIVSSERSTLKSADRPIKVGDEVFYYLPRGVVKIDGTHDPVKGWIVTVTPTVHADPRERYELSLNKRYPFFDHTATLTTDGKGLLKTVTASSTDRTVDAVGALITAAGQVLEFGASLGLKAFDTQPAPFHLILDPFDPAKRTGSGGGFNFRVSDPPQMIAAHRSETASATKGRYAGIMTRLSVPLTVTTARDGMDLVQTEVLLPDPRQRYLLTVPRGPLVASETKVEFENGMMVSRDMKRPSIAYGILSIPKSILSALVPIPGAVRAAEITRIQNQSTLIKETVELGKLQSPSPTPSPLPNATPAATP